MSDTKVPATFAARPSARRKKDTLATPRRWGWTT